MRATDEATRQAEELKEVSIKCRSSEHREEVDGPSAETLDYEKRLLRKTDRNVIPILFLLFLCAYIDRYGPVQLHTFLQRLTFDL